MSKTFNHTCIKPDCDTKYTDTDPDDYYCESCIKVKNVIAEEVNKKIAGRESKKPQMSTLQQYDAVREQTGTNFPNIADLGIKL